MQQPNNLGFKSDVDKPHQSTSVASVDNLITKFHTCLNSNLVQIPIENAPPNIEKHHTEIISERTDDFLMETWEPEHHLLQCRDKIDAFEKEQKKIAKENKKKHHEFKL